MALEIDSKAPLESREFMDGVWNAIVKLYGEYGASRTGLSLIRYDVEKKFAVIRTSLVAVDLVKTALVSITRIGSTSVAVHVSTVSGTIKSLHKNMN